MIDPEDLVFLLCVEANRLDPQARMLCASIREHCGIYRNARIVAISPRPALALPDNSREALEALGVTYISLPMNDTRSAYGTINRIVAGAWAEANIRHPFLVVLDTDMVFVDEPAFFHADVGVRPVDVKGTATTGGSDPMQPYWARLCALAGIRLSRLPIIRTTIGHESIHASYNGGFTVIRRNLGILTRTRDIFFTAFQQGIRPLTGSCPEIRSSTGMVDAEAAEWWGASQAALSIAIWATTSDVHIYDEAYNIPIHILARTGQSWPMRPGNKPVLLHYHYLAEPDQQTQLREAMQRLACPVHVLDWIGVHLDRFHPCAKPSICLSTLAIHEPYRTLARRLYADAMDVPWVILTDDPDDFRDLNARSIAHQPTGPMARDYLESIAPPGKDRGAAAYHDKRFALFHALEHHQTAIFLDADTRIHGHVNLRTFPPGIAVLPVVRRSIIEHLRLVGTWRLQAFIDLAIFLTGSTKILDTAPWCHESCIAITRDGREEGFFETWGRAAAFMQERGVFSGEGGVIGMAAALAGWAVNFEALLEFERSLHHQGGGPKGRDLSG